MPIFIQPSFAKGEIAPALHGRVDTAAYQVALRKARNMIVHAYGGISNRPGLMFVGPTKHHTYAARLIDFQFKSSDTYVLEFGDFYMRVIRNGAHVTETPKTITAITQANPGVVTATAHGFLNGQEVYLADIGGMTELNGRRFVVANKTTDTFELTDQVTGANVNTTSYGAYTSGGTAARIYEITTLYAKEDLDDLKFVQSADMMTLTHRSYPVQELTRTGHTSWTMSTPTFQPEITWPTTLALTVNSGGTTTYRYIATAVAGTTGEESLAAVNTAGAKTITGATAANPVVITATAHGFSNGDEVLISGVGGMTELNGRRFIVTNKATNTFELFDGLGQAIDGQAYTAYTSGGSATLCFVRTTAGASTPNNTVSWAAVVGASSYNIYRETNGVFGYIGSSNSTSFTDVNIDPDTSKGPPKYREVFLLGEDFPGTASYFEQRRVFGGSTAEPDTSRYSQIGRVDNFSVSTPNQADDAITATLTSRSVNEIRHFIPGNDLLVFTSGGEWRINSGVDSSFEAGTIKQKPQSNWGSSHIRPLVVGNTVMFVTDSKAQVRSFGYSLQIDGYTGTDMTLLAGHMFETYTLADWSFANAPNSIVHMVRADGDALTMTFNQEQEVIAWATWDTQGKFERVSALKHGPSATEDEVYFVVRRKINGQTVRYVEKMHSRRFTDVRDAFFTDSGLSYDSPVAVTDISLANPIVITATSHGFLNGDEVDFSGIEWEPDWDEFDNETQPDQLNNRRFVVANKTANTFELNDSDGNPVSGTSYNAYVEGGYVRKAVTTFGGLWHLEGKEVTVLADGNVISGKTISSGSFTLAQKASRVHVGLKYIADVETLNVESPQGTIQGRPKKIPYVTVRFERSRGLFIGPTFLDMDELKQREFEAMGDPTELLTGDKRVNLPSSWNSNGRICLRQRYPLPMTILAIIPRIEVGDG